MSTTSPLSIRIPHELLEALDAKASELDCTRTDFVLSILANAAGVTLEPRGTVDELVDKRIQALEQRVAALEEQLNPLPEPLTQKELAERLGVSPRTISKHNGDGNLLEWSGQIDPDGWGWIWDGELCRPVG